MGRHGFPGITRRFGMQLPLVAICARHLRWCVYLVIIIYNIYACRSTVVQFGPAKGPLNAQRANVGPASNDSKVNNIALKTATLVLRFS